MELRHLRYFVGVAEEENVSRAALKLHVSQPALSRQIRDLEDELGVQLLERSAKSVRLTPAGRAFLTGAHAVLQRADDAIKTARALVTGGGELHIGYAPSLTARILPATLRRFQAELPNARAHLHDLSTQEMLSGLRHAKLHLAFLPRPMASTVRGLHFEELVRDPVCVAVASEHPWAQRRTVTVAEIARERIIAFDRNDYPEAHELLRTVFASVKVKLRIAEEHDSVSSLIAAVEAGNGVAVATQSLTCAAGLRLTLVLISPTPEPLIVGVAWPKNGFTSHAARFLQCARATALKPN